MIHKTLVIGLGQIGMGYDFHQSANSTKLVFTHSQALSTHPNFELLGGVDKSPEKRIKFSNKYNRPCYAEVKDALDEHDVDVVVIASSTDSHLELLRTVLSFVKPKLIVLEKPLAYSHKENKDIIELGQSENVPIAVNYFRAFEPTYLKLRHDLREGLLGFPITAIVKYSNGMINNGSHWVEYVSSFLGDLNSVKLSCPTPLKGKDFNGEVKVTFGNGTVYFMPFKSLDYYLFEIEILGPLGKISIDSSGKNIEKFMVKNDPLFQDLKILSDEVEIEKPFMENYQRYLYDDIASYLDGKKQLSCSSESLETTLEIFSQIENQMESNYDK